MNVVENDLLKLHPETVMTVRKMYNLDRPGDMDRAIDLLEEWLKKQHHLTRKEYPREYLERSIILRKGSIERAKAQIDKLCSLRTIFPRFFEKHDAIHDLNNIDKFYINGLLPILTEDHYRVYVGKFIGDCITPDVLINMCIFGILLCEYRQMHDYCNGYEAVFDFRQINLKNFIATLDFITLHQFISILMQGYGLRIKGIHTLTSSKAIELLVKIVKPMFGPKVGKRIHVHREVETLYDHLPRDVLPSDMGGDQESIARLHETWKNYLGAEENVKHFKEMSEAVSNDAYTMKEKLNGTFRTLNVD